IADENGMRSIRDHCGEKETLCVFEFVYFARPDSVIEGECVHEARKRAGTILAKEHPVDADVVIGVPDSGLDAALGYAEASNIPYGLGFIKNRYIGRTFIQPAQNIRENSVRIKLNVIKSTVAGKRVILIDDSIVRGTTSSRIVHLLREAGATEVHMRLSSPPFINPCFYGTDIDGKDKLIACRMSIDEIAKYIGVDSLGYLSVEGVRQIAKTHSCGFCDACFTGNYPVEPPVDSSKNRFDCKISEQIK
ncbi:MAG: amidophosphoribosyltransferase, partial [Oscillospiraceae bacterium]|nr:amidophosphoribosyltransferase [Oscillospiraceae bacterium]